MNNYIVLDGKRYKTVAEIWQPQALVPKTEQVYLGGTLGVTWGDASFQVWSGPIIAPITPESAPFGSVSDIRTSLAKRQKLTFTDHYGNSYNVVATMASPEQSMSPKWDGGSNKILFFVELKG